MKQLVILGGGFAGFWSAVSAVRQAEALGLAGELKVTVVNKDAYFGIRPRYYEAAWAEARVPLTRWLTPLGIDLIVGEVHAVRPEVQSVAFTDGSEFHYDQLVLATGSRLRLPQFPGKERLFNTDTYKEASALDAHMRSLAAKGFSTPASRTFVVLGGSFTGLEIATALPARLKQLTPAGHDTVVHLVERSPTIGAGYEASARAHIEKRLRSLGVHIHLGKSVDRYEWPRLVLESGEELSSETVIAATGVHASPLTAAFSGPRDPMGRLVVDDFLRLPKHADVLVAGDACKARTDTSNWAVMSCQHAMPQGKFAGHNAVNILFGKDPIPYSQPRYVTCLDLGPEDALATTGWNRQLNKVGAEAKALKTEILTDWIYPPANAEAALVMAAPEVQR